MILISLVLHCERFCGYEPKCCRSNLLLLFFQPCFDKKKLARSLVSSKQLWNHTKHFQKASNFFLKETFKMSDAKRIKLSVNFNGLPPEMVERILKLLPFKDICQTRLICKRWKEIIDKGNLVKDAAGNSLINLPWIDYS